MLRGAAQGGAAVVASGSLTVEDLWTVKRLAGEVPGLRVVVPERRRGEDDGFLIRADRNANTTGASALGLDVDAGGASSKKLMEDVASGRVTVLLSLAEDLSTLPGGEAALKKLVESGGLVAVGPMKTPTTEAASVRIPAAAWSEFEGTFVNYRGRAQRVRRAVTTRSASLATWQLLERLMAEINPAAAGEVHERAAQILREIAEAVPAFQGVNWTALGGDGMQLKAGEGVPEPGETPRAVPQPSWAGGA
jgi:NADH-quinone oxidoreductase subunit G